MEEAEGGCCGGGGVLREGLKEEKAEVVGMEGSVLATSAVSAVSTQECLELNKAERKKDKPSWRVLETELPALSPRLNSGHKEGKEHVQLLGCYSLKMVFFLESSSCQIQSSRCFFLKKQTMLSSPLQNDLHVG